MTYFIVFIIRDRGREGYGLRIKISVSKKKKRDPKEDLTWRYIDLLYEYKDKEPKGQKHGLSKEVVRVKDSILLSFLLL